MADGLEQVFLSYCGKEAGMDGKTFAKLCKDCRLLDKKLTATDTDLIFAKVAPKGQRRINFDNFSASLEHLATKKGASLDSVKSMIADSKGPVLNGTTADAVRFHDDKSTYTGTHINGGPESVAKGLGTATQLASSGMDTGHGTDSGKAEAAVPAPPSEPRSTAPAPRPGPARRANGGEQVVHLSAEAFEHICQQLRTSELLGPPAAQALEEAAGVKGAMPSSPGSKPTELRTKVADVREDLGTELARQREQNTAQAKEIEELRRALEQRDEAIALLRRDAEKSPAASSSAASKEGAAQSLRPPSRQYPSAAATSLQQAFAAFADGKPDMDQKSFVKLCKDVKIIDKSFTSTDADLIFAKVVTKGQRRIDFSQFKAGLDQVAAKKGVSVEAIHDEICHASGPTLNGTVADSVRFHDDKSTYTGTHVNGGPESVGKGGGTATQLASAGMATGQ